MIANIIAEPGLLFIGIVAAVILGWQWLEMFPPKGDK